MMLSPNLWDGVEGPLRILCLGAHCDDIEIGCGATLLALSEGERPVEVNWAIFSSTPSRAEETRAAARGFLAGSAKAEVEIFTYRDGYLPYHMAEVKDRFEALKEKNEPQVIFTHFRHDLHQDHRLVNELTWNTFRDHLILEYEIPKYDGDLGVPNLFSPLREETMGKKIALLMASYPTQAGKGWFEEETFRSLMRIRGMECRAPSRYAEAFYVRKLALRF